MIQLIVLRLRGAPLPQTLAGVFGPAGGTLGRAPSNTLVLDDPDRTVSRLHAQLLCRDGAFFAVDRGSNPMQHNGRAVGSGNEVPLADGDRLRVGGFELEVKAYGTAATAHAGTTAAAGASDDPFADLLGPAPSAPSSTPSAPHDGLLDDFADLGLPAARAPRATDDELIAALLRGLASTHQPPRMLTPGLMERIGVALRAATEGTLHKSALDSLFDKAIVEAREAQMKKLKAEAPRRTERD